MPHTKSQFATKVTTVMGKQYNNAEKKTRRKAYIKRKKATVKAKKTAKGKPAAEKSAKA